jgi:hypothetical protein
LNREEAIEILGQLVEVAPPTAAPRQRRLACADARDQDAVPYPSPTMIFLAVAVVMVAIAIAFFASSHPRRGVLFVASRLRPWSERGSRRGGLRFAKRRRWVLAVAEMRTEVRRSVQDHARRP